MSACTFERFTQNVAAHVLTIRRDDGLHRHLTIQKPGSSNMHYHITTWPGYLCISGDMGCFVFARVADMFEFFRGKPGEINPQYWQEKVQAGAGYSGVEKITTDFCAETVDARLDEFLANFVEDLEDGGEEAAEKISEATQAVSDFKRSREDSDWDCISRINNWDPEDAGGMRLDDFWDGYRNEFNFHYIWCCYAIVHAIALYDAAKPEEVAA